MSDSSHRPRATLTVTGGALNGQRFELHDRLTIGRRPENSVQLPDRLVSRFHAAIDWSKEGYYIEDLGSRAGTVVNGWPAWGRVPLPAHAQILVGGSTLVFEQWTGSAEVPTPEAQQPTTVLSLDATQGLTVLNPDEDPARLSAQLSILLSANRSMSSELVPERLFDKILDSLFQAYPAQQAVVLTYNEPTGQLVVKRSREAAGQGVSTQFSHTIADRAFRERVGVLTADAASDQRFDRRASIAAQGIRSVMCAPLLYQKECLGVIYVDSRSALEAFDESDLRLLNGLAATAASALRTANLIGHLQDTATDTLLRLSLAADYRDDETGSHIQRMSHYTAEICYQLGLSEGQAEAMRIAATMHDVGKIGIPDDILKKPGKLSDEEFDVMKRHPVIGGEILSNPSSELMRLAREIALSHHERFDGAGYPSGLKGEEIPLSGRIVAVADVFDAISCDRVYRPAMPLDKALRIIEESSGSHFDPRIVEAFFARKQDILHIKKTFTPDIGKESSESTGVHFVGPWLSQS